MTEDYSELFLLFTDPEELVPENYLPELVSDAVPGEFIIRNILQYGSGLFAFSDNQGRAHSLLMN